MNQISNVQISHSLKNPETINRNKVNLFWTGGFDSTFRLVQLSRMDIDIQPYYLTVKRHSERFELKAISLIIEEIEQHPDKKCNILPLKIFDVLDLEEDKSVNEAYKRLHDQYALGCQYEWLSRFSRLVPGIELCIEKSLTGRVSSCFKENAKLKKITEGVLNYYILDENNTDADLVKIFGNFHFPHLLFETTKLQMVDLYKKWGYERVMESTWFCHTPINNEPCGICNPCISVMSEGLDFRLPPGAVRRYNSRMKYGEMLWFKIYMKYRVKLSNAVCF